MFLGENDIAIFFHKPFRVARVNAFFKCPSPWARRELVDGTSNDIKLIAIASFRSSSVS
jgi:hypothetical protein